MQNMQSGGREDWNWEPLGYILCHSPVRKLYSTVSKSTTIPGIWDHIPAKSIAVTDKKITSLKTKCKNASKNILHKI